MIGINIKIGNYVKSRQAKYDITEFLSTLQQRNEHLRVQPRDQEKTQNAENEQYLL